MVVDAFGKVEVSNDIKIDEVKTDKDISAITYDNLSMRGNPKRKYDETSGYYNNNRNQNYSVHDGSSIHTYGSWN